MAGFTFKLKGFEQLQRRLKELPKELQNKVAGELEDGAKRMVQGAKRDAPGDQGLLRGEITHFAVGPLTFMVVSGADYSGYVEFGTRSRVQIPAGLEEYAAEVKLQKGISSLSAKEAIYGWCKRKGIDPKLWFPIYRSLMTKGMHPHPFFFKQLARVEPEIIKNVQRILDSLD